MATRATIKWLTASLYYNEPWEFFLAKAVKPYVEVVLHTGVAESFFFERDWTEGPHIRLFFKGSAEVLDNILRPNLQEHFQQYFESRPSYPAGRNQSGDTFPPFNNTIKFDDFDPESERFGGNLEMTLCEKQFQASSLMVLNKLREKISYWSHSERLSIAIKLHLSFAYSVGMRLEETARFFQFLELDWMTKNIDTPFPEGRQDFDFLRYFRRIFDLQKSDLVTYHSALWELFKNYRKSNDEDLIEWFHTNASIGLELNLAIESGKLKTKPGLFPDEQFNIPEQARLWNLFAEFVQCTNNRLGIRHNDEGYLFFALSKSLRSVISIFHSKQKVTVR